MKTGLKEAHTALFGTRSHRVRTANLVASALPDRPLLTMSELVVLLNEDLILEYTSALQYFQHYARIQGKEFSGIREELKVHAFEEIGHAAKIAERIAFYGATPAVGVNDFKLSSDARTMLEQDLGDEGIAIARYKSRVMQALSLKEFGLADILQDILVDEESHLDELANVLS